MPPPNPYDDEESVSNNNYSNNNNNENNNNTSNNNNSYYENDTQAPQMYSQVGTVPPPNPFQTGNTQEYGDGLPKSPPPVPKTLDNNDDNENNDNTYDNYTYNNENNNENENNLSYDELNNNNNNDNNNNINNTNNNYENTEEIEIKENKVDTTQFERQDRTVSLYPTKQPTQHMSYKLTQTLPKQARSLGKLQILPPKPEKMMGSDNKISDVKTVEKIRSVTYNKDTGEFKGLPEEWKEVLNRQFGVLPKQLPGVTLKEYPSKIPKVLVTLKNKLVSHNGFKQVGIFRLAPNASDSNLVKKNINKGNFNIVSNDGKNDVNVYANLIKVWFRDLPDPLLNCVKPEKVEMAENQEQVVNLIAQFPEPNKSIFLWLCDMCVECAVYHKINKMGPQNLAIVIGPNLFDTTKFDNPMKAMTYSQKVVEFFKKAILWRQGE